MNFKIGTVVSNADITRSGVLKVAFTLQDEERAQGEWVRYVSPYGTHKAAFVGIPQAGSTVLCGFADAPLDSGQSMKGYFFIGCVMGLNPSEGRLVEPGATVDAKGPATPPGPQKPIDTNQSAGVYGPPTKEDEFAEVKRKNVTPFPDAFAGLYEGKGITPEMVGLAQGNSAMLLHSRSRGDKAALPFQDDMSEIRSGAGKSIRCVDSPIVDGIVMSNEHKGSDYFIFSTGNSDMSPFAAGEFHTRTHGPINTYTLESNIHTWVEDGRNLELENRASGKYSPSGDRNGSRTTNEEPGSPSSRIDDIGNEDYGCVKLWSHHNNVSVSALEDNSVIHVHAPGGNTKVIVNTGGTVDIVADKKITMTSLTEVELNAPMIQLNGGEEVELNAPLLDLNADDNIEEHAGGNVIIDAGSTIDADAGSLIDMKATSITLN
tara:strand:+ start:7825 stop:9123 length:1299 start_codon:yes stop_codon:yes gene_type:complete